jgi:hypothetical protein
MSTTVGTAVIDLKFSTRGLQSQMKRITRRLEKSSSLSSAIGGSNKSIASMTKGLKEAGNVAKTNFSTSIMQAGRSLKGIKPNISSVAGGAAGLAASFGAVSVAAIALSAAVAAAVAVLAGLGAAIAVGIPKFAAMQEMISRTGVLFRESSGEAEKFIDSLVNGFGLGKAEVRGLVNQLQGTLVPLLKDRREALKITKELSKRAIDIGSFTDRSVGEVARLMESALLGNTIAAKNLGAAWTQAELKAKAVVIAKEKGLKATSQEALILARNAIIQEKTADSQDDLERTSKSLTNAWRRVRGQTDNILISIGEIVSNVTNLPALLDKLSRGLNSISKWLDDVAEKSEKVKEGWTLIGLEIDKINLKMLAFFLRLKGDAEGSERVLKAMVTHMAKVLKDLYEVPPETKDPYANMADKTAEAAKNMGLISDGVKSINREAQKLAFKDFTEKTTDAKKPKVQGFDLPSASMGTGEIRVGASSPVKKKEQNEEKQTTLLEKIEKVLIDIKEKDLPGVFTGGAESLGRFR